MTQAQRSILEQAFNAEIAAAFTDQPTLIQPDNTKVADEMVAAGLLLDYETEWMGVVLKGYSLTPAGHIAYCEECAHNEWH